jgi:hypothetical protein
MQSWEIGRAMISYANDNSGEFPNGKSSTEVFQKLMDGGYVTDPTLFYIPLRGKTKPVAGQELKPENICWDVTCPVDKGDSNQLPLVFMTGYKVSYLPGGTATPLLAGIPHFTIEYRDWREWVNAPSPRVGIAVYYKDETIDQSPHDCFRAYDFSSRTVPDFVPSGFAPKGKAFRQLTPEGPVK